MQDEAGTTAGPSLAAALAGLAQGAPHLCLVVDLAGPPGGPGLLRALRIAHPAAAASAEARLRDAIGPGPALLRAGDLHAVLLRGAAPAEGLALAERAVAAFAEPLDLDGLRLPVVAAAAVLAFRPGDMPPEALVTAAVLAVQAAQSAPGRVLLREETAADAHRRLVALVGALPAAFAAADQLHLLYQPRLALATRLCTRLEALIRWRHPVLGAVGPAEFVPLAEELGLSRTMTAWVIEAALRQTAAWRGAGTQVGVAVNIVAPNLEEPDFAPRLAEALARHALPPEAVELELTESAPRPCGGAAQRTLAALKALGVRVAIDDFGTGYSNFSELRSTDARILKIDRSFVRQMTDTGRDRDIVQGIIGLAHRLGYWVTAEGIETDAALDALAELDCDEGQGYAIAHPLPPEEVPAWVAARLEAVRALGRPAG